MKAYGLARLGRDAEIRYTQGGDPVASLSLAFSYGRKGEDGRRPTQWVDGSLWGNRAEALAPYLLRGGLVVVSLEEIHMESYQGQNGEAIKLVGRVTDIELAGGGERHQAAPTQAPTQAPARQAPARPAAQNSGYRTSNARPAPAAAASGFDDMADDVPF